MAASEATLADRRSFLRGLAALPLIGGSVALIGTPIRAAVPVTRPMLVEYADWLLFEHHMTKHEIYGRPVTGARYADLPLFDMRRSWGSLVNTAPSTRAAVILSAAGVPLMGFDHA